MGAMPLDTLHGVSVLVVDDNGDAREILRAYLTYLGAFVVTANTAQDALRKLRQVTTDVVITDVRLGERDAMWLLTEARKYQPRTPFIAVSGLDYDEPDMQSAGFVAYLQKPVSYDRLVRVILAAVNR
jgi:two-component system response regulator YesN